MVDTFYDEAVVSHSDRMSDVASTSDHRVPSSGRPSCSSCSGSSRPSSGGGSAFRQRCSVCKMKHHKKQPCRQNAVDAEHTSTIEHGVRTVVSLRIPPGTSPSALSSSTSCVGHFEVGRSTTLFPSTASESSGGEHSSRHRKCAQCSSGGSRKRHSDHSKGKDPGANLLSNIKALFNNWLEKSRASKSGSCGGGGGGGGGGVGVKCKAKEAEMSSSGVTLVNGDSNVTPPVFHLHPYGYLNVACPQFPQQCTPDDLVCMHNVISINSSFDSDCLLHCYNHVASSKCSTTSIPTTLSTTTNSEAVDLNLLTASAAPGRYWDTHVDYDVLLRRNPRLMGKQFLSAQNPLVPSRSCPTKSKSLQSQGSKQKDLLCSTWPPSGKRIFLPETEEEFQVDHDDVLIERIGPSQFAKEHLYEFNIPFSDIKFTECLKSGSCRKKIHRGLWHGEVMIHTYDHLNHKEISKFWEEVQKLSMVRHENISLFMGASMDPPNFAVVTETRKGCSLYEKLHVSREKTSQSFKLNVLRQLAQALGYLHAKGIVVKRLNSKHIYLEPKVKLCLLDFSALEDEFEKDNSLALHNSVIYYMAPEVLTASFTEDSNRFCDENVFTNASDVFAFGTIMFEVQTSRYPYYKLGAQRLMECICEGKREDTKELRCSDTVKNLIQDCWSHDPLYRPEMSDINKDLQHRNAAHKRHSSSEPENLHRLTFGKLSYL